MQNSTTKCTTPHSMIVKLDTMTNNVLQDRASKIAFKMKLPNRTVSFTGKGTPPE